MDREDRPKPTASVAASELQEPLPSAASLGLARLDHRVRTGSTMDDAHRAAADGAPAGTLIVADTQDAGRGRGGRHWASAPGAGLWMTLVERPSDRAMLDVLALRLGVLLADALDPVVNAPVRLKWPNDLYVGTGKLAGVLVEARWRDVTVDWVAIGVGVNLRVPADYPHAASVQGTSRAALLERLVPVMRQAARGTGPLTDLELAGWRDRDLALGRTISAPVAGIVAGIAADGALLVQTAPDGEVLAVRSGSLVFADL